MNEGMAKGNDKKIYTPEDISSKSSVLEDQLIGGLDDKYDDSVQKLIDIAKEKGYLLYDEVSDLLPPEIGASAEDLDELFRHSALPVSKSSPPTTRISPHSTKFPATRNSIAKASKKGSRWISLQAH
jgi:Sigma-70 factor, region 1.1